MSTIPRRFSTWTGETQYTQFCNRKPQRNKNEREAWSLLQHFKVCSQSDFGFWFHSEEHKGWRVQINFTHMKTLPCWNDLNVCAPGTTWQSSNWQNWRNWVVLQRMNSKKSLEAAKLECVWCFTQIRTYGLHGRCFTKTSAWKTHNQFSHVWREYRTAI